MSPNKFNFLKKAKYTFYTRAFSENFLPHVGLVYINFKSTTIKAKYILNKDHPKVVRIF